MMKVSRPETPEILQEADQWGVEYAANKAANPSYSFQWKTRNGKPINQHILPLLKAMTADHCAYCDGYPVGQMSLETIDHFRPKSVYPELAYQWQNLFLCCTRCQAAKKEEFSDHLLKPDEADYDFNRFFIMNFDSGEIEVNLLATDPDKVKASYTIELLDLNAKAVCISRQRELRSYDPAYNLDSCCYRYLFG
jgi:uncharacterized protein (TIGR02646 family)